METEIPDLYEIIQNIPVEITERYRPEGKKPLLIAYGCVLLEQDTGGGYIYTAVNLKTGRRIRLSRRLTPVTASGIAPSVEKIRGSSIAGARRWETDRRFQERMSFDELRIIQDAVFLNILPQYGYAVRRTQIELANHMMESIRRRDITLAEAEVGTGKTHAYLIAAILVKRGRANDFWNMGYYPRMRYMDMAHMPVVISTSGIALQKAIVRDYIPEISKILMAYGIIKSPLTAVIRKGKEHYVCEHNLLAHIPYEHNDKTKVTLESLLKPSAPIDLAEIDGLTNHVKRKICVPDHCPPKCPKRLVCRYMQFLEWAQSPKTDIQVCNHNYIIADAKRRSAGEKPLIPNFQSLIIDEGHKLPQAARQMYGIEFSNLTIHELSSDIKEVFSQLCEAHKKIRKTARNLSEQSVKLFRLLDSAVTPDESGDDAERYSIIFNEGTVRSLRKIRDIADSLIMAVTSEKTDGYGSGRVIRILRELAQITETAAKFARHNDLICWLEKPETASDSIAEANTVAEMTLRAIPADLAGKLYNDLWSKPFPVILTSGTLSSGMTSGEKDFTHIKRMLGLDYAGKRLTETSKPSPFNHRENAMLYISENMPYPDNKSRDYISAVADETERLIRAAHGHTAALFTSYKVMDMVHEILAGRGLPFPFFRLERGAVNVIEKFKRSGSGVLFASGAMWEGVDIPGDALSMLIIVKAPFAVPDPVSEFERTLYPDTRTYIDSVVVPEMLIKLKQGFGRLIRAEGDTGVVAILDSRVNSRGQYREQVLAALPDCWVTADMVEVEGFFKVMKKTEYFL